MDISREGAHQMHVMQVRKHKPWRDNNNNNNMELKQNRNNYIQ